MESETYKAKVYCKNCDFRNEIEIPKGKKIEEVACPNCGTNEIAKDLNAEPSSYYNFN